MEKKTELVCWLEKKSQIMDFLYDRKISLMFQGIHPLDQNPREISQPGCSGGGGCLGGDWW